MLTCPVAGQSNTIVFPGTLGQDIVGKDVSLTFNDIFAVCGNTGSIKEIIFSINNLPSRLGNTFNIVEHITTDTAGIQAIGFYIKAVAGGGSSCAPFHNGVTFGAEGAAGVTVFGTGSGLVFQSLRSMLMPAGFFRSAGSHTGKVGEQFGIHLDRCHSKGGLCAIGKAYLAQPGRQLNVDGANIRFLPHLLSGIFSVLHAAGFPGADRQLCQHSLAAEGNFTGSGNGNGRVVGCFIDAVSSAEALRQFHVIQLPCVLAVQIDNSGNALNFFNGGSLYIQPIYRTDGQFIGIGIFRYNADRGCGRASGQHDLALGIAHIAHIVADLDTDGMRAVGQSNIADRNIAFRSTADATGKLNAVNINLGRRCIQAGIIRFGGIIACLDHECHGISGDRLTIDSSGSIRAMVGYANGFKDGSFPVRYRSGVIKGKVVNVQCVFRGDRSAVVGRQGLHRLERHHQCCKFSQAGQIRGNIYPASAIDIAAFNRIYTDRFAVRRILNVNTDSERFHFFLFGKIDPEAEAGGVALYCHVLVHKEELCPAAGKRHSTVGEIQLQGIRAITVANHAGLLGYRICRSGLTILSCQRKREAAALPILKVHQHFRLQAQDKIDRTGNIRFSKSYGNRSGAYS